MAQSAENSDSWRQMQCDFLRVWPSSRWRDVGVVVGCSGGADSVALLRTVCELRCDPAAQPPRGFVIAAHFNHQIRGRESDEDQRFVASLANQLGAEAAFGRSSGRDTDESSLRRLRLEFLQQTAERSGARYVALAHSADDNAETILHHLMRGTGPLGLAGIRPSRPLGADLVLIRPFLSVGRGLIRQALDSISQPWREDSSNLDTNYRRNWIRHQLMPLIQSRYAGASDAIARAGQTQRQWCEALERLAGHWLDGHWIGRDPVRLRRDGSSETPVLVAACQRLWSILQWPQGDMSHSHWLALTAAIEGKSDVRFTLPGGIGVLPHDGVVELRPGEGAGRGEREG
jgi:tRNA(Ile)-lysidine synthase